MLRSQDTSVADIKSRPDIKLNHAIDLCIVKSYL